MEDESINVSEERVTIPVYRSLSYKMWLGET